MKNIFALGFLYVSICCSYGQTISGHVYDAVTGESLIGVNIFYIHEGETSGSTTDTNGFYEITVPDGGAILNFSYIGYETQTHPVVTRKKQNTALDIYMKTQSELMSEVVVSAGRFDQKLSDITVSMEVLKSDQLKRQNTTDLSIALNTLPGVDVTDKQPSIRGGSGWTYGVGSRSQVLVDGMSVLSPGVGEINWNVIPMENVAQVEVIKGASSVLYGSSALNGLINVRTSRPGMEPQTSVNSYIGIYLDPEDDDYVWWDDDFWHDGKFDVEPLLRQNLLYGIRNPIYTGTDLSHSRRIGNFDVSGGLNLYTNEGYRQGNFNQRVRFGGNVTYYDKKIPGLSYGLNGNYLSNNYSGFFIWRSSRQPYMQSPLTNMSRQGNTFYIDPFLNYNNTAKGITHRFKARYFHKSDQIKSRSTERKITDILDGMGFNYDSIPRIVEIVNNYQDLIAQLMPSITTGLVTGDFTKLSGELETLGRQFFPSATSPDVVDLLSWAMARRPFPSNTSEAVKWISDLNEPNNNNSPADNTSSYYVDYQFGKRIGEAQITTGATYEHISNNSSVTGSHKSDNIALFLQYDQKFFEKLNLSLGMRLEYYRVDSLNKEAETSIFGWDAPFKPVFRGGLNYQMAEHTYIRASFGQGYRYPSITEKFVFKDIGGIAAYPNPALMAESGYNAELGIKQGYKLGPFMGYLDFAGFYTYYKDMIEFQFGLFNNETFAYVDNLAEVISMIRAGQTPGLGTRFMNIDKARIWGIDVSVNGMCQPGPNMKLTYSLGYVYIDPVDPDWKKKNRAAQQNKDPLAMKEKSNDSKYLKYRQKHSFKGVVDFQWRRLMLGTNLTYKSKTLAVDYFMVDERDKDYTDIMDIVRGIIFPGLHDYWIDQNTGYFAMDGRLGVSITKGIQFWVMMNNLLNTEYSLRPMDVSAPRTLIFQVNAKF